MSERFCGSSSALGVLMAVLYPPGGAPAETKQKPRIEKNQPIQIVSDRLDAYNEKRMVVFSGNAVATQGARTIRADRLTLYYKENRKAAGRSAAEVEGTGDLERVEAKGHVTITEGERVVTGEEAVFEQDIQKITMTGDAVLREGANIVRGDRIVVFLNENRGVVESVENRRVTATIYPGEPRRKKSDDRLFRRISWDLFMGKLTATDLVKIYGGRRVVDRIHLEINPGEVVGLLGPNGAGKTTTFYMIVGLIKPDGGAIFLDGEDLSRCPMYIRARKGLNYLPQEPSIFRKLTVRENILAILETLPITAGREGGASAPAPCGTGSDATCGQQGLFVVRRREEAGGDHAGARHLAEIHPSG